MFLERCGILFFSRMRPTFFFLLVLFPILCSITYAWIDKNRFEEIEENFAAAFRKGRTSIDRKTKKERFLQHYLNPNPYFLDQEIESLKFLQKEKSHLESFLNHPALLRKELFQKRLSFLNSQENRLSFIEENIQTSSDIKETEEKQRHPIQLDEEDLQKLLTYVEDLPIKSYVPPKHSPQILIRDFKLRKIETALQTSIFELEMDLLKREFTKQ